jgi:hypothetical protein
MVIILDGHELLMLKCMFVDSVYMNVMRINSEYEGLNYLVCDSIEEYLRFEQHCLCLVSRVNEEDMSEEKYVEYPINPIYVLTRL